MACDNINAFIAINNLLAGSLSLTVFLCVFFKFIGEMLLFNLWTLHLNKVRISHMSEKKLPAHQ